MTDQAPLYESYYVLNRDYFSQCFDESAQLEVGVGAYRKAIVLAAVGVALHFTDISPYATWFLLAMAAVEYLSVRYRRAWWIARQQYSRAAGTKVEVRIDAQGLSTKSLHQALHLKWDEVSELIEAPQGFIITADQGRHYLTKSGLDEDAQAFIRAINGQSHTTDAGGQI